MAGSLFGRLSLEEGDSANSLEGLEIKLGGEGKNRYLHAECVLFRKLMSSPAMCFVAGILNRS